MYIVRIVYQVTVRFPGDQLTAVNGPLLYDYLVDAGLDDVTVALDTVTLQGCVQLDVSAANQAAAEKRALLLTAGAYWYAVQAEWPHLETTVQSERKPA